MTTTDDFFDSIINSLKSGDLSKIKSIIEQTGIEHFSNSINSTTNKENEELVEESFYKGLSKNLKYRKFDIFREMFDLSIYFDIFIDIRKFKDRFEILSELLLNCTEEISTGYQTYKALEWGLKRTD